MSGISFHYNNLLLIFMCKFCICYQSIIGRFEQAALVLRNPVGISSQFAQVVVLLEIRTVQDQTCYLNVEVAIP